MKNELSYNYGIIGNCTSAALVSADCSIDWLCLPFFDSPSLFASILDKERGGYFKISAVDIVETKQTYIYHTAILKTVFVTKHGVFEVRDFMPRFHSGRDLPYCPSEIQRDLHVISGKPKVIIELKPRPNYGLSEAKFAVEKDYLKITSSQGEYISYYLYSNLDFKKIVNSEPIDLEESSYMLLSYHQKLDLIDLEKIYIEYEKTKSYWLDWTFRTQLPAKYKEMALRSFITLKLLSFQRTGALIAAPTTSLPEVIGQERNWDYRYCWVRDAAMIIDLYARLGHKKLAERFINFILDRMLLKKENIAVVYGINGEQNLEEKILEHLSGYENSRPVRIGNLAYQQKQNDLYGELIETIYSYFVTTQWDETYLNEEIWTVVRSLANNARNVWKEPDCGIWERRGEHRHFVHSKLMNWVAMDRAAKIARHLGKMDYADKCLETAKEIKKDILEKGWNEQVKAFTMSYGSTELDASNLLMLHYGFLSKDDPRIIQTVEQSYKHLMRNNFMMRYTSADEFGTPENAFIVCSFWMVNALYLTGKVDLARQILEHILSFANPLGLLSEDIEPFTGRLIGNFPQGYSHLALVQSVLLLETDYNWSDVASSVAKHRNPRSDGFI